MRKLAGRFICEGMWNCMSNQDFFCDMFDLVPLYGRVTINQRIPPLIKQKLAREPDFLASLHEVSNLSIETPEDVEDISVVNRYWSFPEYRQASATTLHQTRYSYTEGADASHAQKDIGRSLTPRKTRASTIRAETMSEYLNFPDPSLYLIGFQCE